MLVRVRPRWPKDGHSFTNRATSSVRERRVPTKPAMKFVTLADKTLLCMSDNKLLECEELRNLPNRLTNKGLDQSRCVSIQLIKDSRQKWNERSAVLCKQITI